MGLGAYPASGKNWLGMLGMHGTYEANMAMHDCDVMICVGARFDDRITGRISAFSPNSKKIHIDIDPSSINKNVRADVGILGDVGRVLEDMVRLWRASAKVDKKALYPWWEQIARWRARDSLAYRPNDDVIMPQYAVQRLYALTKDMDTYITTEVGQHQMWAAQHYHFEKPNRWMTSGGLGTMGYGLPAALGVQIAHPDSLVIDIAGDASVQMTIQEMSTAVQYEAPIKIFILNNQYMGMVRQWQQLLHGNRLSHSYTEAMPDFVMLAQAYGGHGIRCDKPDEVDDAIKEMIAVKKPVIFDCRVAALANCFPMIPSGKAHNEMLLPDEATDEAVANAIDAKGQGAGVRPKWFERCAEWRYVLPQSYRYRRVMNVRTKLSSKGSTCPAEDSARCAWLEGGTELEFVDDERGVLLQPVEQMLIRASLRSRWRSSSHGGSRMTGPSDPIRR